MAIKVLNQLDMVSSKIVNLADPTANQDAATKAYVDSVVGSAVQVDTITATQTGASGWLLPTGAKMVKVICIGGGGGGGGGGRSSSSSTAGQAGGGGGGGGRVEVTLPATAIGTPGTTKVDITIGAGGNGGNGATTSGGSGSNGSDGGTSLFGSFVYALGGKLGNGGDQAGATPGTNGLGAFTDDGNPDTRVDPLNGGQGGFGTTTNILSTPLSATGGGGGGGRGGGTSTPGVGNIGSPIYLNSSAQAGADGTAGANTTTANATATAGGAGTSRSASGYCGGGGGGGGAQNATTGTTGIGGAGGTGGLPGGGGGGGGGARSTSTRGGNAGAGGRGEVIIITYF